MNNMLKATAMVGLLTATSIALGATSGMPGKTSTASINVSLTVADSIVVKDLQDFDMHINDSADPASLKATSTGCVVANYPSATYTLSAASQNGSANGAFQMKGNNGHTIGYQLAASDGSSGLQTLNNNAPQLKASNSSSCNDGRKLQLHLSLAADAQLKPSVYNDVATLQVTAI